MRRSLSRPLASIDFYRAVSIGLGTLLICHFCLFITLCYCYEHIIKLLSASGRAIIKERKRIYIAPLLKYLTLKALRYGSHSVTCKPHRTCLYLVSIHQMAHPRLRLRTSNCSLLLIMLVFQPNRLYEISAFKTLSGCVKRWGICVLLPKAPHISETVYTRLVHSYYGSLESNCYPIDQCHFGVTSKGGTRGIQFLVVSPYRFTIAAIRLDTVTCLGVIGPRPYPTGEGPQRFQILGITGIYVR